MGSSASELRIPAERRYIVVAKRAAAAFGAVAGFDIEAIDDLTIATAQACDNAIAVVERNGAAGGELRLVFKLEEGRLELQVRSICRAAEAAHAAAAPAASATPAPDAERIAQVRRARAEAVAATDLALRVMGLFVDDCNYRVDERSGGLRVRLTKYRA